MLSVDSLCQSFWNHSLGESVADRQQPNPDIQASNLMQGDLHVFDQLPLAVALWRMFAKRRRTKRLNCFFLF